ncbi:MAG: hypothetical protein M5U29_11705 [Anaerolineae bacterium]|nr:hypothetical protein [Anaerolineae bacterium]
MTRAARRLPPVPVWLALLLMIAAVVAAALILMRVAEPLYGLVFGSGAPLPEGAVEIERVTPERGAAYRVFRTAQTGREVAAFYEEAGGACVYAGAVPGEGRGKHGTRAQRRTVQRQTGQRRARQRLGSLYRGGLFRSGRPDDLPVVRVLREQQLAKG